VSVIDKRRSKCTTTQSARERQQGQNAIAESVRGWGRGRVRISYTENASPRARWGSVIQERHGGGSFVGIAAKAVGEADASASRTLLAGCMGIEPIFIGRGERVRLELAEHGRRERRHAHGGEWERRRVLRSRGEVGRRRRRLRRLAAREGGDRRREVEVVLRGEAATPAVRTCEPGRSWPTRLVAQRIGLGADRCVRGRVAHVRADATVPGGTTASIFGVERRQTPSPDVHLHMWLSVAIRSCGRIRYAPELCMASSVHASEQGSHVGGRRRSSIDRPPG
jgi:hypothetical protein